MELAQPTGNASSWLLNDSWEHSIKETIVGDLVIGSKFMEGELTVICDWSVKKKVAAAAWIITFPADPVLQALEGSCTPMGCPDSHDSHRTECSGLLGGLIQLHKHLTKWNIYVGKVTFVCDNIQALCHCLDIDSYDCTKTLPYLSRLYFHKRFAAYT
jgi:hypothetical protein